MKTNYIIDWDKTLEHIKVLLEGRTYISHLSEALNLSVRGVQHKFNPKGNSTLQIEDLLIIAHYCHCSIEDLLIFKGDKYIGPDLDNSIKISRKEHDHHSPAEVNEYIDQQKLLDDSYPIRDMYELMLYLPLFDEKQFRDSSFRCYGNLTFDKQDYFKTQMKYLYSQIPDSPAKEYADGYRDNVLRAKGHPGNNLYDLKSETGRKTYYKKVKQFAEIRA